MFMYILNFIKICLYNETIIYVCHIHVNISILAFKKICILFILFLAVFCLHAVYRLLLVVESGGYSSLQCMGFSLWWLLLLQSMGSRRSWLQ